LSEPDLFEPDTWLAIAVGLPELHENPEGAAHLVYRFLGKYLPALLRARTPEERGRVWLAFWSYLIARQSRKKPFGLSHQAADELIARIRQELESKGIATGQ